MDLFGGDKAFKQIIINDTIKEEFCNNAKINLLRISYNDDFETKIKEIYEF